MQKMNGKSLLKNLASIIHSKKETYTKITTMKLIVKQLEINSWNKERVKFPNLVNTANLPKVDDIFSRNKREKIQDMAIKTYTYSKADIDKNNWFNTKKDIIAEKLKN
jgi:hypothetical protein